MFAIRGLDFPNALSCLSSESGLLLATLFIRGLTTLLIPLLPDSLLNPLLILLLNLLPHRKVGNEICV